MSMIDMRKATPDEKESVLGREFRELDVWGFDPVPPIKTVVLIEGKRTVLVGDPQAALRVYLAGTGDHPEVRQ